eukprot:TRINITY_DN2159_c0_g1_i4.p1 TRINITY_DN2159_c0_g1~~TRINITY_DN2159_c0_g1_i4.p1  ORF type:complete len:137 (-),score=32.03 TRINITY_DN2159_c0_g1_i4:171-581(-)
MFYSCLPAENLENLSQHSCLKMLDWMNSSSLARVTCSGRETFLLLLLLILRVSLQKNFKGNLGKIIHDIYQTAHVMFGDMPQGDHKKRAKYRFASKTIMRILPADLKKDIEGQIEAKKITMDLYEILGKCTWVEPK